MLRKMRKMFSFVLVCALLLTSVPGLVFAADGNESAAFGTEEMIVAPEIDETLSSVENQLHTDLFAEDLLNRDRFFYLEPCEQTPSEATLDDNFEDKGSRRQNAYP